MSTKKLQITGDLGLVSYNSEQNLAEEQRETARVNIGVEFSTDEEIIEMLAQEDTLLAVTDGDGSILSTEGNVILW